VIYRYLRLATLGLLAAAGFTAQAAPCPTTSLTPSTTLPAATVGIAYLQAFGASNSNAQPFDFRITSGLPAGFGLGMTSTGASSANLTGTPAQIGSYLVTITATDTLGCSGGRTYALSVAQGSQTISFTSSPPASAAVGGAAYSVSATATSGLPVTLAIDASASSVCSIAGSSVSFQSPGSCVINANQAGNANYAAAPQAQQSFGVGRADQTLSFTSTAPAAATVGGPAYSVSATATSGLTAAFSIDASAIGVCAIAGNSVTFLSAGTCVVNANQAGNANFNPAPQIQQSFAVGPGSQTTSFTSTAPATAVVAGAAYTVTATATSGLPVAFTIDASASSVCSIAGSTVSFIGAGTCVINANQAGDANWNAAPQVQQSFAVARGSQTVSFTSTAPAAATVAGATYTVTATATSGLAVAFTIDPIASGVCSIAGSTVSFIGAGTCVINANQAGDANWNAAPQVQQSFAVARGNQTISFTSTAPAAATFGGPAYTVTATATSGLPVAFTIDASAVSVCAIAGSTVSFIGAGTCVVNANQAGNANWNAAPQVQQTFAVSRANQSISFTSTAPTSATFGGPTYTVTAMATSGLPIAFTIDASASSVCSIAGDTVSLIGTGTCVINANQAGDTAFNPAPQVQQSFAVARADQTISFTSTAPTNANVSGGGTYTATATATSGLPVSFAIDASAAAICSISGSTVSFLAAGTCVINADQAGDANWNAAPQAQQSFVISACLDLAVGQVVRAPVTGSASVCIQSSSGAATEYTYLPISLVTSGNTSVTVTGTDIQPVTGPPLPRPEPGVLAPLAAPRDAPVDQHAIGTPAAFPPGHVHTAADLVSPQGGGGALTVGQLIDLNASVGGCGIAPDIRKGRVEAITTPQTAGQPLLYAVQEVIEQPAGSGTWVPPVVGGYQTVDFQNMMDAFVQAPPGGTPGASFSGSTTLLKTGAMDILRTNLGELSDVDSNDGVIVFFTRTLNELSPPASSVIVPAMFQPRDLFAAASCGGSNQGEILYLLVPDPTGSVNSNVRTLSFTYGNAGPSMVHHAEHLFNASRRLYFNGAAPLEQFWLDEALAWSMQELVFYSTSVGLAPRGNVQLSSLTTGPNASIRVAAFNTYENPMFGNARSFFYQLGSSNGSVRLGPLRQQPYTTGTLPVSHDPQAGNFAHTHAFLRYALDRKNTGDAVVFNALVNTGAVGTANLSAALAVDANDWVPDFLVAAYADDSAVTGLSPEHTLPSWNYRSVYGGLGGFPLTVDNAANATPLTVNIGPGGGTRYVRVGVAAGQQATIAITDNSGANPALSTAIIRTR
jgi:hypothetical protein